MNESDALIDAPDASRAASVETLPPGVVALVPMRNVVLFPQVLMPVTVGRAKSLAAVRHALQAEAPLAIVLQRDARADEPGREDLCDIGTLANVVRQVTSSDGQIHAVCHGMQRFRLLELVEGHPFLAARIERIDDAPQASTEAEALGVQLRERAVEILSLLPGVPAELSHALQATRAPDHLADITASLIDVELVEKQALLETLSTEERLRKVLQLLTHRIEVLRLSREIGARTKEQLQDRERKFLLREQLKTIQTELGEEGEREPEIDALEQAIAKSGMPADTAAHVRKELARLRRASAGGAEAGPLQTWLEWMTELPWTVAEHPPIDLAAARQILEADHFGLDRVKQRILEFLAVRKLNPQGRAPILCFVGPPGVGKTSLGQSIARALQRPFVRVSLGGVHDEAEMRGHRRTYVGALPGNIIQGIRKAGARDCVMMLDEVDKMSASFHGDPSAALLEVLDPEQNASFRDNYLGVPFDLSRVVFIATANVIDNVSAPVRDRMELIELPGYTQEEKLQIARRYLLARQLEANGLSPSQCEISDEALQAIVSQHTREAGVRQFEREIARVMRHAAMQVAQASPGAAPSAEGAGHAAEGAAPSMHAAEGAAPEPAPAGPRAPAGEAAGSGPATVRVEASQLEEILGAPRFEHEVALRASLPGVATGLAWTPVGGDILFIEATRVAGTGRLILTGQLGDVMKESAQAALTLVKSHAAELRIPSTAFDATDVHLHVPAGAIPKDGPSAGVAMFVALASLFCDRAVRHDTAMTGEISLRGLVLPVGGIKEKVLAAQRAGLVTVLLPARNRKDLRDLPASTRETLQFVWLETVNDAVKASLGTSRERRQRATFELV